jgi:hypothetical protein
MKQPLMNFFSAAYLAAASVTIGAITLSSLTYQSDVIFQLLPSQVWIRAVRAPSWSAQDILIGRSTQQDSAERAFNRLTRTFTTQMDALKR